MKSGTRRFGIEVSLRSQACFSGNYEEDVIIESVTEVKLLLVRSHEIPKRFVEHIPRLLPRVLRPRGMSEVLRRASVLRVQVVKN